MTTRALSDQARALLGLPPAQPAAPPGLFGVMRASQRLAPNPADSLRALAVAGDAGPIPMPGPISGFGGGTFNLDGSMVTPPTGGGAGGISPPANSTSGRPIAGPVPQMGTQLMPMAGQPRRTGMLGNSFRQPFDYDAALAKLSGDQKPIKDWRWIVAGLAAGLGAPYGLQSLMHRQQGQHDRLDDAQKTLLGWQHADWARQNEADLQATHPFSSGRDRLTYDPATGQTSTIYDGPEDFELYAAELGLHPGTEDYFKAVEDYVLRANGPSAFDRDTALDDYRTDNDAELEALRQGNREDMENLRQRNRGTMEGQRQRNRLEVRRMPNAGNRSSRPTATDASGRTIYYDASKRKWVDAQGRAVG